MTHRRAAYAILLLLLAVLGLNCLDRAFNAFGRDVPQAPPPGRVVPVEIVIEGYYLLLDSTGKASGVVVVTRKTAEGPEFLFQYMTREDPVQTVGFGLREGNQVNVGWRHANAWGVTRFKIELDKKDKPALLGRWTNYVQTGEESLTWLRALD